MRLGRGMSLLIGGARSGKSDLAVRLGQAWSGPVTFVATATAGDADMTLRIERHQDERPTGWGLIESPFFGAAEAAEASATSGTAAETSFGGGGGRGRGGISRGSRKGSLTLRGFDADETTMEI